MGERAKSVQRVMDRVAGSKWALFFAYACVALGAAISLFSAVLRQRAGVLSSYEILLSLLLFAGLLALFCVLLRRNKEDAGFVFLLVGTPALFGFGLFVLPDQVPDEIWHIYRVLNFTGSGNGGMISPDSLTYLQTPRSYESMFYALAASPDWGSTHVVDRDMSSYLSHLYAAPGVVAALGKLMNLNPFVVVYMARMANIALFLVAAFWVLRIIPLGKTVTFVYLLNPILLQQEASCSADAFLNAVSLLFVAYFLKLLFQEGINKKEWAVLACLLLFTCISKYAYAPLALMLLFLVPKVVRKKKAIVAIYASVAAVSLAAVLFALFIYNGAAFKDALDLVRSPGEFVSVLLRSLSVMGPFWLSSFGGANLGPLTISAWTPCLWAYFVLLAVAVLYSLGEKHSFKRGQKIFIGLLIAGTVVLIILAFREWTINVDERFDIIMGVQGRYFIPLFLLPLLCFVGPKSTITRPNCLYGYSVAMSVIIASGLASVVRYFW